MKTQKTSLEKIYYKKFKNNDKITLEELLHNNTNLIHYCINKSFPFIKNNAIAIDDLVQEGYCALWKAILTYDPNSNCQFSTYAYTCIQNQLYTYYYQNYFSIHIPIKKTISYMKYQKFIENYYDTNLTSPTETTILENIKIQQKDLTFIKNLNQFDPISLQEKIKNTDYGNICLEEVIEDTIKTEETTIETIDQSMFLYALKQFLSPQEYYILYTKILSPNQKSEKELMEELQSSQQSVNNYYRNILKKLKEKFQDENGNISTKDFIQRQHISTKNLQNIRLQPISLYQISLLFCLKPYLSKEEFLTLYYIEYAPKYYSINEIATILNLSPITIKNLYHNINLQKTKFTKEDLKSKITELLSLYSKNKIFAFPLLELENSSSFKKQKIKR